MLTWDFSRRGFPGLRLGLGFPVTSEMKVGLRKLRRVNMWATRRWTEDDPMIIRFDALPACDGRVMDTPRITERDKNLHTRGHGM